MRVAHRVCGAHVRAEVRSGDDLVFGVGRHGGRLLQRQYLTAVRRVARVGWRERFVVYYRTCNSAMASGPRLASWSVGEALCVQS